MGKSQLSFSLPRRLDISDRYRGRRVVADFGKKRVLKVEAY
jgi:hypothetical protein